jgi:hypothetical protein
MKFMEIITGLSNDAYGKVCIRVEIIVDNTPPLILYRGEDLGEDREYA